MKQNNTDNTNFVDRLNFYQSANSDYKSIKENFVVRIHEFETIIDALKDKKNNDSLQHELILGRRGSGKSTLLKRIEIEIKENKTLVKKYIAINFAEEQASIYQLHDLWFETIKELENKFNFTLELKEFSVFKKQQDYTRYLFNEINKILKKEKRKVVLLIDNFDRILENFKEDAKLLRDFLINHNNIQIIGGSTRINEHFWNHDKPFYDFFRQHVLKSLTFNEIHNLLNSWSAIMNQKELKDYAINNRGKIESIRILTDGMPRTLQFFIRILLTNKEVYGFQYIKKIMDKATPLYQEKLNSLTPAQRKIVSEMAFIWEPTTTKELVNKCRMQSKLVSSYLKQLDSLGIVKTLDTKKRNKKYSIEERFFNMWLIVTQGNPEQKRRAKYLTIFLESWYDENEIKELAEEHLNLFYKDNLNYNKLMPKTKALIQSKHISIEMRDLLIKGALSHIIDFELQDVPELSEKNIEKSKYYFDSRKFDLALIEINKLENEKDGIKFFIIGEIYYLKKDYVNAKKFYLKAANKNNTGALNNLGLLYKEQNKYKEAEKCFLLAKELGYSGVEYNLGNLYLSKKKYKKAEKCFIASISLKKRDLDAKCNLCFMWLEQNKNPKLSLDYLSKSSLQKGNQIIIKLLIEVWNNLFVNLEIKINKILNNIKDDSLIFELFNYLLYLEQKNLVLSYFESEIYGKELKEKFILLYYATLILTNKIEEINLKIPKEVIPAVNDMVQQIKEKNEFYSKPSSQ